ncbi:MAG TPA: hypothetical protein VEQ62_05945 [Stellaceae bacterium]|jgi:hypothetical protein|nr:hypothetical protein [Stellaceae bacterium]
MVMGKVLVWLIGGRRLMLSGFVFVLLCLGAAAGVAAIGLLVGSALQ